MWCGTNPVFAGGTEENIKPQPQEPVSGPEFVFLIWIWSAIHSTLTFGQDRTC
jgi:hypothetical protein